MSSHDTTRSASSELRLTQGTGTFAIHLGEAWAIRGPSLMNVSLSDGSFLQAELKVSTEPGILDLWVEGIASTDCRIAALDIFAPESATSFYEILNVRNRHYTPRQFPDMLIGKDAETTTFSSDWQFAPHPSVVALTKLDQTLVIGCIEPNRGFGLEISVEHYQLHHFRLNLGGEHGQALSAGENWRSPTVRMMATDFCVPFEAYRRFFASCPAVSNYHPVRAHWATHPLYCTWFDQVFGAGVTVRTELSEQIADPGWNECVAMLTEDLVRRAVKAIRREGLPIQTVLLDVGWFKAVGQWEVDESMFPDMRKLVDDLHADGFRVVVWWHWSELDDVAEADPRFLIGDGWRNKYGKRMYDFSRPATREEYLPDLFHRLFSSDPGCYDFDGAKTDFLADKIHPELPLADPQWAGEENYFLRVTECFYQEMRRHKPDAAHIAASGHPWLAPVIDINRTYDVHSTNPWEHFERAEMLSSTCLGAPVAFDFHPFLENLELYFELAAKSGSSVQIGNVLYTQANPLALPGEADEAYWARLRDGLTALET